MNKCSVFQYIENRTVFSNSKCNAQNLKEEIPGIEEPNYGGDGNRKGEALHAVAGNPFGGSKVSWGGRGVAAAMGEKGDAVFEEGVLRPLMRKGCQDD
ncbi:hypothetical protein U1Q18_025920 [Sarracenia purpurea var. burkii]